MKRLIAFACVACASPSWAADVGVGISAKSNDSAIYVPIDFDDKWRLEPLIRHSKGKSEYAGYRTETETFQLGVGLFSMSTLAEAVRIYYGGRLSYLNVDGRGVASPGYPYPNLDNMQGDGFRVAPTFGFEYLFNKHLSLGGEAEWFYEDVDLNSYRKEERSGTETRLILRLRF